MYDDGFKVVLGRRPVNVQCKVNINSSKEVCEKNAISAEIILLTLSAKCIEHILSPQNLAETGKVSHCGVL